MYNCTSALQRGRADRVAHIFSGQWIPKPNDVGFAGKAICAKQFRHQPMTLANLTAGPQKSFHVTLSVLY